MCNKNWALNLFIAVVISGFTAASSLNAGTYPINRGAKSVDTDAISRDDQFQEMLRAIASPKSAERAVLIGSKLTELEQCLSPAPLEMVTAPGRLALPRVLVDGVEAFAGGLDSLDFWASVAFDASEAARAMACMLGEGAMSSLEGLKRFRERASDPRPAMIDLIRLQAHITSPPAGALIPGIAKSDWDFLHNSPNPCYRILALQIYDSVEQTPSDLLALYRECLFGGCSYFEVRALAAIQFHEDYREDVAKLLETYAATNPIDDGTLSGLRSPFADLESGARNLAATIRAALANQPTGRKAEGSGGSSVIPTGSKHAPSEAHKVDGSLKPESGNSTLRTVSPWLVLGVVIAASCAVLLMLLKRRAR